MPRLLAFGCSFTVGQGLPDIYPDIKPSAYAWPAVLGDMLGYEVVNNGVPGAGNAEIAANIFRTEFQEDDICVILWSYFTRYDHFTYNNDLTGDRKNESSFLSGREPIDKVWWKKHNRIKNWLTIQHISLYLQSKNVRFSHMLGIMDTYSHPKPPLDISNLIENHEPFIIDRALDSNDSPPGHPGTGSQRLIAQLFYDRIT